MKIPNVAGVKLPEKIRVCTTAPTTARQDKSASNCLLQINVGKYLIFQHGAFSQLIYSLPSDSATTGTLVLDSQIQDLTFYLTDGFENLYVPNNSFDILVKLEVFRNYEAEQLQRLNTLVEGQRLLLYHTYHTENKLLDQTGVYQGADQLYNPTDSNITQPQ
jgi:hypothetical protein